MRMERPPACPRRRVASGRSGLGRGPWRAPAAPAGGDLAGGVRVPAQRRLYALSKQA